MLRGGAAERARSTTLDHLAASTATLQLQRFGSEALDGYVLRYLGVLAAFTAMMPPSTTRRPRRAPTILFLTCLHLLVNVGMAKDLVLSTRPAGARIAGRVRLLDALDTAAVAPPAAGVRRHRAAAPCAPSPPSPSARRAAPLPSRPRLRVFPGDRLLITGPNGAGKASPFACSPACGGARQPPRCRPPRTSSSSRSGRTSPRGHAEAAAFVPRRRAARWRVGRDAEA